MSNATMFYWNNNQTSCFGEFGTARVVCAMVWKRRNADVLEWIICLYCIGDLFLLHIFIENCILLKIHLFKMKM